MELFAFKRQIDFIGHMRVALAVIVITVVGSIALVAMRGMEFGIDFTGGIVIEVGYADAVELEDVRGALAGAGYEDVIAQHFGSSRDVMIRLAPEDTDTARVSDQVLSALRGVSPDVEMRRVEFVGPQVGDDLKEQGALAFLFAMIGILMYVALRFEYRFAFGSVIALVHDVIVTLGFLALFRIEFDLVVLAALLAVVGYSLNDTVVIYDRIRENFLAMRRADTGEVINASLNQTLSRTFMTGITTLIVLLALLFFGGQVMYGFAMTLIFGIFIGPLSSIYVASWALLALGVTRQDLMPPKKEGLDDGRP